MSMTLADLIGQLESYDDELTIFVDRKNGITPETIVVVAEIDEDDNIPDEAKGLSEFMDVWHAIDVIKGKASLIGVTNPSNDVKVKLLIEYAVNGA